MSTQSETLWKTHQVATALGVGVSTIKRWVDSGLIEARKTVGGHRLIELSSVLRFARERGLPVPELKCQDDQTQPTSQPKTILGRDDEILRDQLLTALKRGRSTEARDLIEQVRAAGADAVFLGDQLLHPVMYRIGKEWQLGSLDIYQEHRASLIVESALQELIQGEGRGKGQGAPLALGSAPEGNHSTLGGLLCELTLAELGWEAMNLGTNLPLASLSNAVRAHRPRLIWLSICHLADEQRFLAEYGPFFKTAAALGSAVILGGRALRPELRAQLVAASFGDRLAHLAEFARRIDPRGPR